MKGTIKEYDLHISAGVIIGSDKNLYRFAEQDWWDKAQPGNNQEVEFVDHSGRALAIVSIP